MKPESPLVSNKSFHKEDGSPCTANKPSHKIKLVVFDVDGVLTNGQLFYGEHGELIKAFNVKDGVGIKLLQKMGICVAVISAKDSAPLNKRMNDLAVEEFHPGSHDKVAVLTEVLARRGIDWSEVAYTGDDVIDFPAMSKCGYTYCPSDAYSLVQKHSDQILQSRGGEGCAREVADIILSKYYNLEEIYYQAWQPEFEKPQ
jgi:3-deoxy-D-manno-octulosonate 8-phosphate phosphatase (KDO 8-P phosphatase)